MKTKYLSAFLLLQIAVPCVLAESPEVGEQIAGYRRDGTGIFPDIKPPTKDLKQVWLTKLPSWGHSSPIVVGDKVFLTVEVTKKHNYFPALVCLDAKTGRILWEQALDHTPALPKKLREAVRKKWTYQYVRSHKLPEDLKAAGLSKDTWLVLKKRHTTNCVGEAYATPVSDGKHIWCVTAWGGFFCFDLDGNTKWMVFDKSENRGEYCRNARNPLLWKGMLISDITNRLRVFDAATGKLLWASAATKSHTIVSPMVMTVDGKDILLAAGLKAFELPGGKPLKVEGWNIVGMQTLVKHDQRDVVYFGGYGQHSGWSSKEILPPAAVRFSRKGDTLNAKTIWHAGQLEDGKRLRGGNSPWMTVYDGKLYHQKGHILDAMNGKYIAKSPNKWKLYSPRTDHLALVANGHVYGLRKYGDLSVYTLDGKKVSSIKLKRPGAGGRNPRLTAADGAPFVLADGAIYVRSDGYLHCIQGEIPEDG